MAVVSSNTGRIALNSLTDSDLNINRNTPTKFAKVQRANSFLHSTPIKQRPNKRPLVTLDLSDSNYLNIRNDPYDISENVAPRLKRARIIKMKLQIAWYKVKTNQTTTPITELKFPIATKKNQQNHVLSPISKKSMLELTASKLYKLPSEAVLPFNVSPSIDAFQLHGSKMDDIVLKRSLKNKHNFNNQIPSSAPASITSFNNNQINNHNHNHNNNNNIFSSINSISSNKYSLELKANSATTESFKLPPISKLLHHRTDNLGDFYHSHSHSQSDIKNEDTPLRENSQKDTTVDKDITIEQMTPVRVTKEVLKKSCDKSICDEDVTQTQIWSSPIQTTPSSIGAARCLLQLAHR